MTLVQSVCSSIVASDAVTVGVAVGVGLRLGVGVGVPLGEADAPGVDDALGVTVGEADALVPGEGLGDELAVAPGDADSAEAVALVDDVADPDMVPVGDGLGVLVGWGSGSSAVKTRVRFSGVANARTAN